MATVRYLSGEAVKQLPGAPEDTKDVFAAVLDDCRAWVGYYPLDKRDEVGVIIWFPPSFLRHGTRGEVGALLLYPRMMRTKLVCYPHKGHPGAVRALKRAGFTERSDGGFELENPWKFNWPLVTRP
jgi:RimJ/RimL family protein N-acetyltransferase